MSSKCTEQKDAGLGCIPASARSFRYPIFLVRPDRRLTQIIYYPAKIPKHDENLYPLHSLINKSTGREINDTITLHRQDQHTCLTLQNSVP